MGIVLIFIFLGLLYTLLNYYEFIKQRNEAFEYLKNSKEYLKDVLNDMFGQ